MKRFPSLALGTLALLMSGCVHSLHTGKPSSETKDYPVRTSIHLSSTQPRVGHKVRVVVTATNRTKEDVLVSVPDVREQSFTDTAAVFFVSDTQPIAADSILEFSRYSERIPAKDTRTYTVDWTPRSSDIGNGSLNVVLPSNFQPIQPIPLRVTE